MYLMYIYIYVKQVGVEVGEVVDVWVSQAAALRPDARDNILSIICVCVYIYIYIVIYLFPPTSD